jgi:hypothetical protein
MASVFCSSSDDLLESKWNWLLPFAPKTAGKNRKIGVIPDYGDADVSSD